MKMLILVLVLLAGCNKGSYDFACGDFLPVDTFYYRGISMENARECPGQWVAVPTGPWYRCECPK
jgi:hypothetical protein